MNGPVVRAVRGATSVEEDTPEAILESTAELLGVTRPTLYDLMEKYSIRAEDAEAPAPAPASAERAPK